ncbi:5' nucleotidase, NT5C type [Chitinophaga deserti]|uniref:5' nucleotidase, NT5C type n=1 Tax=Chitinophaga deserti TaxID=2164099 RepID=UPI000D6A93F9|nr:5'(3')-deoxyribonucleotidase [Chitinophaga deserti]
MAKKRIAIDMDGVMADLNQHYCDWYFERTGERVTKEQLKGLPETTGFPQEGIVHHFLHTPGFFRTAPVMEGSQRVILELMENYEVFIVSAAVEFPQSLVEKIDWLKEHFPFISWKNIVFCGLKTIVKADYMIDDYDKNLRYFDGERMLFSAPHNSGYEDYNRYDTWDDVAKFFAAQQVPAAQQQLV